ncbi:hypothetical protein FRC19_009636 [Serendipita sp. 401]|nr:hypothetical protein FRC19_009636 [Serendipita sp. 401]
MRLSALFSFTILGASSSLAFPLFGGGAGGLHQRELYTPVRRTEIPSATPTATESEVAASSTTDSESATATAEPTETSSVDNTNTYVYSTITATDSLSAEPSTRTETSTSETSTTTETTEYPQATDSVSRDRNNGDISRSVIVRVRETVIIREQIIVERPVLVAVQVNLNVRQTIIVQQIQIAFQNRFDNWDINVVNQLARIIAQQFGILSRAGNRGFDRLDNDNFNRFISKFIQQFQIFQSIQLVDVQGFIRVLQRFDVNQLATFFGRSDALFNQDILNQLGINNDFSVFVGQLKQLVILVQGNSFNDDGIFNLGDALLVNGGLDLALIDN